MHEYLPFFVKGAPLRSGCETHLKDFLNICVRLTKILSVSKLILWYLNMSSINLATRFKIGMYICRKGKSVTNALPSSVDVIQLLN